MKKLLTLAIVLLALLIMVVWAPGSGASTDCTFTIVGTTMTLDGNCTTDETIWIPDGFTLDGAGHTITAVDTSGGHFVGAVVQNASSTAHAKNLTVTASGLANVCDSGANRLRGILFDGASGSITNNTVTGINQGSGSGCQEGNGIEVRSAPFDGTHPDTKKVTIQGNTVASYQKNGITANGDIMAIIRNNTVTGFGPVAYIAQNGIQVGFGARGEVMRNIVVGSWYTGASWTASGLLVFDSGNVVVQDNGASGNQTGVAVETWCWGAPSANNNKVVRNTIQGAEWGVSVSAYGWQYSSCDASADNNKVVNNSITTSGGDTGVFVGAVLLGGDYTPSADNNKVIRNTISGYTTDIDDSGTATKAHANVSGP
jgi:hypothetical protein